MEDFNDEHLEVKIEYNDNQDLNLFNQFEHHQAHEPHFDFEYEDKKNSFERPSFADEKLLGPRVEPLKGEVKKSISFNHLNGAVRLQGILPKAESCINLHELAQHPAFFFKKPNSKNIFIQKIRTLLSDNDLRGKIETDKAFKKKITESKAILKIEEFEEGSDQEPEPKQPDKSAINGKNLEVDGGSDDSQKYTLDKTKNRVSAQNTRKRKKLYIEILEVKLAMLEAKNKELSNLLRLNGIEFDDSPLQQSPSQSSETPADHFDRFIERVAACKSEKEVLKGFSEFRTQLAIIKDRFREEVQLFMDRRICQVPNLGLNPFFKLYQNFKSSIDLTEKDDKKHLDEALEEYTSEFSRESQLLESTKRDFQKLFSENKKSEECVWKIFKKLSKKSTVEVLRQLANLATSRSTYSMEEERLVHDEEVGKRAARKSTDDTEGLIGDCLVKKINVSNEYLI